MVLIVVVVVAAVVVVVVVMVMMFVGFTGLSFQSSLISTSSHVNDLSFL